MELACRDRFGVFNATFFKLWTCSMCYTYLFHDSSPAFITIPPNGHQLVALPSSPHPPGLTVQADVDDPVVVDLVCATLGGAGCNRWTSCCRAAQQCCEEQAKQSSSSSSFPSSSSSSFSRGAAITLAGEKMDSHGLRQRHSQRRSGSSTSLYASDSQTGSDGSSADSGSGAGFRLTSVDVTDGGGDDGGTVRVCPRTWDGFGCFKDTEAGRTASIFCPGYIDQSDPHGECC